MTQPAANILEVDDEDSIREGCRQALEAEGHRVRTAADGRLGLLAAHEESFDIALLDLKMPGVGGMQVLKTLREESPHTVVLVITGYATIESAVEAIREGAYDYLPKPFTPEAMTTLVARALDRRQLAMENLALRLALKERSGSDTIIGDSPAMTEVIKLIRKVAPTDATVLLTGETGVGKELAARALHAQSYRREKPFVVVDCAALAESLLESELFGHVRGAYTGATETTVGKFELASGGTVFLDEIGNIGPDVQAKLLRVLQEREIVKVGGTQRIKVDIRIIAATNKDLLADIRAGRFREDLFYRLSVVPIRLPALRERRADIRPLAVHFLKQYAPRRNRSVTDLSEAALRALESYDWPGNVRELENTIERALVMAESRVIGPGDLFFYGATAGDPPPHAVDESAGQGHLAEVEKREIAQALERFQWQMAKAADYLGINRKTLREKIKRYGLSPE